MNMSLIDIPYVLSYTDTRGDTHRDYFKSKKLAAERGAAMVTLAQFGKVLHVDQTPEEMHIVFKSGVKLSITPQ
jgi:exosome complex RNA-binding protein Rrp42 (RNase PH superfamily)